jgi:hypothetical protein
MRNLFIGGAVGAVAFAIVATTPAGAQETTSSIRGTVTADGKAVAGAKVIITHVPSGTRSTDTTDAAGVFSASGLRVGGPFTVVVSAPGYPDYQVTDIQTSVGQAYTLPVEVAQSGAEIVVTATKVKGAGSTSLGPVTVLNAEAISKIASVNRDIRDLMRRDPFASIDTSSTRAVSFAGVNPRFNRFTIDGVPITDSFGLNPDALPSRPIRSASSKPRSRRSTSAKASSKAASSTRSCGRAPTNFRAPPSTPIIPTS